MMGSWIDRVKIQGKQTTVRFTTHPDFLRVWAVSSTYIISDSGDRIHYFSGNR
jgi:hypothetical protein